MGVTKTNTVYFDAGKTLFDQEKYDEAIVQFEKAVNEQENPVDAYYYWGLAILNQKPKEDKSADGEPMNADKLTGFTLWKRKQYNNACRKFEKAYELNAAVADIMFRYGCCLRDGTEPKKGIEIFEKYIQQNYPLKYEALINIGHCLEKSADPEKAIDYFEKANTLKPGDPKAIIYWSKCLIKLKRPVNAIEVLSRAIAANPAGDLAQEIIDTLSAIDPIDIALENYSKLNLAKDEAVEVLMNWADKFESHEEYPDKIKIYRQILKIGPGHQKTLDNISYCLAQTGRQEEAIELLKQAFQENPDLTPAYANLGRVLSTIDPPNAAWEKYSELKLLAPNSITALQAWGDYLQETGKYEQAIPIYEELLKIDNNHKTANYNIGKCLTVLYKYEDSIEHFQKACESDPENMDALFQWGYSLLTTGNFKEALDRFNECLEKKPDDPAVIHNIGHSWLNLREYQKALEYFDKVLKISPDYTLSLRDKAYALLFNGNSSGSVALYQSILKKNPDDKETCFQFANALLELNLFSEAIRKYEKVLELDENYAYAAHNIAFVYYRTGQFELANKRWHKTTELYEKNKQQFLDGKNVAWFINTGSILVHFIFDFDAAEKLYLEGLTLFPDDPDLLNAFGYLNSLQKNELVVDGTRDGKRIKTQEEGGQNNYDKKTVCHTRIWECYLKGTRILDKETEPKKNEGYYRLIAQFHLLVEDYDKAIECLKKAISLNENSSVSYSSLGFAWLKANNYTEAIRNFKKGILIDPVDMNLQGNLAEAYLKSGNYFEAENILKKLYDISPYYLDALFGLGELYKLLGDEAIKNKSNDDAEEYFTKSGQYYKDALAANNEPLKVSRRITGSEKSAINYSLGYINAKLYETRSGHDLTPLKNAIDYFKNVSPGDSNHLKANSSITKIKNELKKADKLSGQVTSKFTVVLAFIIFLAAQFSFFYGRPVVNSAYRLSTDDINKFITIRQMDSVKSELLKLSTIQAKSEENLLTRATEIISKKIKETDIKDLVSNVTPVKRLEFRQIDEGSYALISFGALLFIIAGLVLKQLSKLSVGAIQLEKSTIETASGSTLLNIKQ